MNIQHRIIRILGLILIGGLCVTPEMMQAASSTQQQNSQSTQSAAPQAPNTQPTSDNPRNDPTTQPSTPASPTGGQSQSQTKPQSRGTTVDPSQAPLQPVTTYPGATTPEQDQQPNAAQSARDAKFQQSDQSPQPKKPIAEPVGAAAAAKVATTGGAAARPAGVAIAPAKQHQTRSLLIKLGAIAAAGIAAGTVYGLSRKTPSTPPNTGVAGSIRK